MCFNVIPLLSFVLGVAIGAGWQSLVAYINIGCYYIIGLPAAILLGFTFDFGVEVMYYHYSLPSFENYWYTCNEVTQLLKRDSYLMTLSNFIAW